MKVLSKKLVTSFGLSAPLGGDRRIIAYGGRGMQPACLTHKEGNFSPLIQWMNECIYLVTIERYIKIFIVTTYLWNKCKCYKRSKRKLFSK